MESNVKVVADRERVVRQRGVEYQRRGIPLLIDKSKFDSRRSKGPGFTQVREASKK